MNIKTKICLFTMAIILSGCASTKMTSMANPETIGRNINKIFVHGDFQNLEYRRLAEEKLCKELTRNVECECLESSQVFFPGEEYSVEQIANRLNELQVDAVLTLQLTGSGITSKYVPQTTHTTGSATVIGNKIKGSSTTRTYGGYDINKPWANYEVILLSTTDGKVVWYATAASKGSALSGWDDLIHSASSKTISRLLSDGIFEKAIKVKKSLKE